MVTISLRIIEWAIRIDSFKGYLLQYSGLENSMDCIVHGVTKSQTRLRNFHFHFLFLLAVLWNSAFIYLSLSPLLVTSLLSSAICKASSDNHFAFLHFFFLGMVLIPAFCTMSQNSVHVIQALCLSDLVP